MTSVPSATRHLAELTVGIPGAGRRTLLEALGIDLQLPANFRLCVLDAERLDAPAQLALLDELAADPDRQTVFALNKADRVSNLRDVVTQTRSLLAERGFSKPRLYPVYPVCAAAARLFTGRDEGLPAKKLAAREAYYERFGPGENSLSAFAVTGEPTRRMGSRAVTPRQLLLAVLNTGVPSLAAALEAKSLCEADGASRSRQQAAEDEESEPACEETAQSREGDAPVIAADREADASFAELMARAETADCETLLELARRIPAVEASDELRSRAMDLLHEAYLTRQTEELDALTRNAEELDLDALRALADRINNGPYTVQTRTPYAARLNRRIDELQTAALDALCAGVEEADSRTLAQIRAELERTDCAEVLKSAYFRHLDARQEKLDIETLNRVTAGAETMTEKELRTVAVTLEANNWNPRYVNAYRHRVDLCREALLYRQVQQELTELNDMERREVLALRERIAGRELPRRYVAPALKQIDEKLFRLDMLRLMALQNDFDRLDFDGIDELRAQVARGDCCERARSLYLNQLLARENALILENTSARAELTRQLIAQHKLRASDFTFASLSRDYQTKLDEFWGGTGLDQPRDIPVFLFDTGSRYAMTATRFYFKAGRQLEYVPLENIARFQVMKQHLTLILQIVGKDNSYRLTEARISRGGAERTLAFLNECVRRWAEPGPAGRLAAALRVRPLEAGDYTAPVEPEALCLRDAWELLCEAYQTAGLREGNLIRPGDDDGVQCVRKLREAFGLSENASVVWYSSASRFGSAKEAMAVGPAAIYQKVGKDPVRSIPLAEIYAIRPIGGKRMTVTSLQNETVTLPVSEDMTALIADYVRTVQLGDYLRTREKQP